MSNIPSFHDTPQVDIPKGYETPLKNSEVPLCDVITLVTKDGRYQSYRIKHDRGNTFTLTAIRALPQAGKFFDGFDDNKYSFVSVSRTGAHWVNDASEPTRTLKVTRWRSLRAPWLSDKPVKAYGFATWYRTHLTVADYHLSENGNDDASVLINDEERSRLERLHSVSFWHATVVDDWADGIMEADGLMIHAGSKRSAIERIHSQHNEEPLRPMQNGTPYYMYEVRIKADAQVYPQFLIDMDDLWERNYDKAIHGEHNTFLYANTFESKGSLSVYVRADMIHVRHMTVEGLDHHANDRAKDSYNEEKWYKDSKNRVNETQSRLRASVDWERNSSPGTAHIAVL